MAELTLNEGELLGRPVGGHVEDGGLNATAVRTILNVENGADVTDAANVAAAGAVMSADVATIVVLTQTEYDALSPPDADTLYVIVG